MEKQPSTSYSRNYITSISSVAAKEMQKICSSHSDLLRKLERCEASTLPETYSYEDKSSTRLAAEEQSKNSNMQIDSPPKYQWKEIKFTSNTNTKVNGGLTSLTPRKSDNSSKIANDSGFFENYQDVSTASSNNIYTKIEPSSFKRGSDKANKTSYSNTKGNGLHSQKKVDSVEKCPLCGEKFPISLIEEHAAGCGSEDIDEVPEEMPRTKKPGRPDRLAKTNARKRLYREAKVNLRRRNLIHRVTAVEDSKGAGREVDVESIDDDVVMIENAASSS